MPKKKKKEFDIQEKVEVNATEDLIIKILGGICILVLLLVAFELMPFYFAFIGWGVFAVYFIWVTIKYFVLKRK